MKNWIVMLLLAVVGIGAACSDDDGKANGPCGEGDAVAWDGATYCVYDQSLIIEGFRCPAAAPNRFDGPGGDVVCSPDDNLPDDELDDILERWNPGENVDDNSQPNIGPGDENNHSQGECTADEDCPMGEECNADEMCVTPTGTSCDGITQPNGDPIEVGDEALVIDWTCPITQCCGDGVFIASCPDMGGDYVCAEGPMGYYECAGWDETQMAGCPVVEGDEGDQCAWTLDEQACGDGLYCDIPSPPGEPVFAGDNNRGTCEVSPALCNSDACYSDADCGGEPRAQCYGADARNGVLGVCRDQPVSPPSCLDESDCPLTWECVGATLGCADACGCADPSAADTRGTCESTRGRSVPALWLRNSDDITWTTELEIFWAKRDVGVDSNWINCPSYAVELYDEAQGWVTLGEEVCRQTQPGEARELTPDTLLQVGSFPLSPHSRATEGLIRLRGDYYVGCTGTTVDTCSDGPFERYSPAQYVVKP